jgi:hypothetical protein
VVFSDADTGTMSYTINGASGSKAITRYVFASGSTAPATDYSGLWMNANESGWGIALTRQSDVTFATIYTYDSNGNPKWYIASSCPMVGSGCSGPLYSVTGGSPLTTSWSSSVPLPTAIVGDLKLSFSDLNNGTMNITLNGASNSKTISRYIFANPPTPPAGSCTSTATPPGMNYSQSGNTISITTTGCIPVPTSGLCSPSSPQATGINVLETSSIASSKLSGLTFNVPGMSTIFDSLAGSYANIKTCLQNAPAGLSSLRINYNICYDITSQLDSSIAELQATGMVTVSKPITIAAQGTSTMQTVPDCLTTGADLISDAFTGKVLIKGPNGTYTAVN